METAAPEDEFTCLGCGNVFRKGRPDAEVTEEAERVFGDIKGEGGWKLVCTDCYPSFLPQGPRKCEKCGHDMDPHTVVAPTGNPRDGGVTLCPECDCVFTWSPEGVPPPDMPSDDELERIREQVRNMNE